MNDVSEAKGRLRREFHETFIPERQYLKRMLQYAATEKPGTLHDISQETGIPMGDSSGKMPAIYNYTAGMGLIIKPNERLGNKGPRLTPFGEIVLNQDPFLNSDLVQWMAHLHLCDRDVGADLWYRTFVLGIVRMGFAFKRSELEQFLSLEYQGKSKVIGPLVNMYNDAAAFETCGALTELEGKISRKRAPLKNDFMFGYAALITQKIETLFPGQHQVPVDQFEERTDWLKCTGWEEETFNTALVKLEQKGLLSVDRNMRPWLLQPKKTPIFLWNNLFKEVL